MEVIVFNQGFFLKALPISARCLRGKGIDFRFEEIGKFYNVFQLSIIFMLNENAYDKEVELKKLEIVKETADIYFKIASSIMTGGFAAIVVLILTQAFVSNLNMWVAISGIVVLGVIIGGGFLWSHSRNMRYLDHYSEWVERIERKEELPSIKKMFSELDSEIS